MKVVVNPEKRAVLEKKARGSVEGAEQLRWLLAVDGRVPHVKRGGSDVELWNILVSTQPHREDPALVCFIERQKVMLEKRKYTVGKKKGSEPQHVEDLQASVLRVSTAYEQSTAKKQ